MIGGVIQAGNSKLLLNGVGVVDVYFQGWYLGRTTGPTTLNNDEDILELKYQQSGTKRADEVRTGQLYTVSTTLGDINTTLLKLLMSGFSSPVSNPATEDDAAILGRSLYVSRRASEGGVLKLAAVDADGIASEAPEDIFTFYAAIPKLEQAILNWDAGSQRALPVSFDVYFHEFPATGGPWGVRGAFGYYGDPATLDVPVAVWPDRQGPVLSSAEVTAATTLVLTMDQALAFQGGSYSDGVAVKINDSVFAEPTGVVIAGSVATATFAAATFAAGDDVEVYIAGGVFEDTEAVANPMALVDAFEATNSIV